MFFYALGRKSLPARLSIKPSHGGFMSNMVSSYLSPTPPKMQALCPAGIHSGIRLLTASWDSNPSVHHGTLTPPWFSPSCVQKYHCAATDHSCTRKQSGLTDRSALPSILTIFALSADVTPRHRAVPEECICSFQGSEIRSCLAPDMYKFNCRDGTILGTGNGDSLPGLWRFAKSR